jgi:hypothetical protein
MLYSLCTHLHLFWFGTISDELLWQGMQNLEYQVIITPQIFSEMYVVYV